MLNSLSTDNSALRSDTLLQLYANAKSYAVISVGYRLAPEHPFPAGPQDCYDVGEYLVRKARINMGLSSR